MAVSDRVRGYPFGSLLGSALVRRAASASPRAWAALLLGVGLLQRAALWMVYQPVAYGDTPSYLRLAGQLSQGWDSYDGTRTPGYPMFLALAGSNERAWLLQMVMGLAITLLVFWISWQVSGQAWFGGLAGMAHTLNLQQLFFEADVLSETLTTFFLALAFAATCLWLVHSGRRSLWWAAGAGLAAGLSVMIRPLFIYLPFWLLLFVGLDWRGQHPKIQLKAVAACLLPALLLVGGWVNRIHNQFGDWSMTTMTGYHLIQHTGVFFEYVPDEYAELRDTYLEFRARQIAEHGNQTNTIWEAIPAMQQVSGKSFYDLSRLLARISVRLIVEHPDLYLNNVVKGWWYFWRVPVYWRAEAFLQPIPSGPLETAILIERLALFAANLVFLGSSVLALLWKPLRERLRYPPLLWCLAGAVWAGSVVQTLVDHGDNPRFLVPLQSFVVLWVLWTIWQVLRWIRTKPAGEHE